MCWVREFTEEAKRRNGKERRGGKESEEEVKGGSKDGDMHVFGDFVATNSLAQRAHADALHEVRWDDFG